MKIYRIGSAGLEVKLIQKKLAELKYSPGPIDGIFGKATEVAIEAFQKDNSIFADGIVGPDTWNRLFPELPTTEPLSNASGQQEIVNKITEGLATFSDSKSTELQAGSDQQHTKKLDFSVRQIKQWLSELGFYEGHRDYSIDPNLKMAITAFQQANHIQPADGILDPASVQKLHEIVSSRDPLPSYKYLGILKQGVTVWNTWRRKNPNEIPELRNLDFQEADFSQANFCGTDFTGSHFFNSKLNGTDLSGANLKYTLFRESEFSIAKLTNANLAYARFPDSALIKSDFTGATLIGASMAGVHMGKAILTQAKLQASNLSDAILHEVTADHADFTNALLRGTDFKGADLSHATMKRADLAEANFIGAKLCSADLTDADLSGAQFIQTQLYKTDLSGCRVFGISAWELELEGAIQKDLIISPIDQPEIIVDDLEVAQFVYLLLNREKIRNVIDTITSKSVLILGRFTPERKVVLDAMANELRHHNLLPIIFDFERASSRDFTETIKTLAGMSLFVIADITNPSSAPLELQALVPDYQIPFVPILQKGEKPFAMFSDLKTKYSWVLPLLTYSSTAVLIQAFKKAIIDEAFEMHKKLLKLKAETMETRSAEDYLKESE